MMKQPVYLFFLFALMATLTSFSFSKNYRRLLNDNGVYLIKYGTSHGFCKGYCYKELVIDKEKIIITQIWWQKGRKDTLNFPDKIDTVKITSAEWKDLLKQINKQTFFCLPYIIGCPDCDDGGSEWIEISSKESNRKIIFESTKTIESIEGLTTLLRQKAKLYAD